MYSECVEQDVLAPETGEGSCLPSWRTGAFSVDWQEVRLRQRQNLHDLVGNPLCVRNRVFE